MPGPLREKCGFFSCDKADSPSGLHAHSNLEVDNKVRECAILLNEVLAKLSTGDI